MKKRTKKLLAGLLAVIMLLTLLPMAIIGPFAEEVEEATYAGPALNETVVGTVNFQSFNFLGDNSTGEDGTDYSATFYYTDDYFAHSAINDEVNEQRVDWDQLDDTALSTCSMDFAVASYTSAHGDVVNKGAPSWNNSNYKNKDKNVIAFLNQCGFEGIEPSDMYRVEPTQDSIAYTLANKEITVWNEDTQQNETYTLVACGIRGAGYGPEWASNVTVGDSSNPSKDGRHKGFDDSAKQVVAGIRQYIADKNISGNVKYWVSGFSRSAAVANLTAGYLTDSAEEFGTQQKDIYGYTYECPQCADIDENALAYKNIHNIVNPMDLVPRVSPSEFDHQRLGVDYLMPYHGNTTTTENEALYARMYEVLKTIAVGRTFDGEYKEDPLIAAVNPSNYPYNRKMTPYTMRATKLVTDAIGGNLMTEFGTEESKKKGGLFSGGNVDNVLGDTNGDGTCDWYLDDMLDEVLGVFLVSTAWDRGYNNSTTDALTHKVRFIEKYQKDMRTVLGYLLGFSGPAFLGLVDSLMDQVAGQLKLSNAGFALAFVNFYNDPQGSYARYNMLVDSDWRGRPKKDVLIDEAQKVAIDVVNDMTASYTHPTISRTKMNQAMKTLTGLVIDLYADELDRYESQYLGTCLRLMNVILSTHEQETVLSWITSLDDNHINRGYRTLTLPANTNVKLHQFREQFEGSATFDGDAPVVAEYNNGDEVKNLDQRIYAEQQGDNLIIRYPAALDIRADVTTLDGTVIDDLAYQVADYQTNAITSGIEDVSQYTKLSDNNLYTNITNTTEKTNAKAVNDASAADTVTVGKHDTFQLIANGTSTFDNSATDDKNVYDTHLQKRYEVTWKNEDGTVLETSIVDADALPVYNGETPVKVSSDTADYTFSGWTPEVVVANADTTYKAVFDVTEKVRTGHSLSLKGDIGVNFYYYIPERYQHDLKLVFNYKDETYEANLEEIDIQGYNYRGSFNVVAAAMTEPIQATLTCADEVIDQQNYSVKAYASRIIEKRDPEDKLAKLCKALLNYGGKSQTYFEYRLDDMADATLGDYTPVSTDDMIVPAFDKEALNSSIAQYGLNYYGSSLVLKTETSLKIYFKKLSNFDANVPVSINGQPAELVEESDSYAYIKVADIPSGKIADIWTITIGDASFEFSATNYIQNVLNGNKEKLKNTVTALYDYYKAAVHYFNN